MPSPPIQRTRLKVTKFQARAVPIAETVNSRPARINSRLRPNRSLSVPAMTAPNRQPISALLIARPW